MHLFVRLSKDTVDMGFSSKRSVLLTYSAGNELVNEPDLFCKQTASYSRNLGSTLILMLDQLLKDQDIQLNTIKTVQLEADMGHDSTAYKIGQAFLAGLGLSNRTD